PPPTAPPGRAGNARRRSGTATPAPAARRTPPAPGCAATGLRTGTRGSRYASPRSAGARRAAACATPVAAAAGVRAQLRSWGHGGQRARIATPVERVALRLVEQRLAAPAGDHRAGIDRVRPGAAVGEQHPGHVERAATADVAQRAGARRGRVEAPQHAQHRLGPGTGEAYARKAGREQGVQPGIVDNE